MSGVRAAGAEPKEAYEKPELRKVKLVAGEVAVTGCKTPTSVMGPTTGCFMSMCKSVGS